MPVETRAQAMEQQKNSWPFVAFIFLPRMTPVFTNSGCRYYPAWRGALGMATVFGVLQRFHPYGTPTNLHVHQLRQQGVAELGLHLVIQNAFLSLRRFPSI